VVNRALSEVDTLDLDTVGTCNLNVLVQLMSGSLIKFGSEHKVDENMYHNNAYCAS
jgi:hypothetical protein